MLAPEDWRIYIYDVWGNAEDGWEVNDVFETGDVLEVPPGSDAHTILAIGADANLIGTRDIVARRDDEDTIYITGESDGKPLGELRRE